MEKKNVIMIVNYAIQYLNIIFILLFTKHSNVINKIVKNYFVQVIMKSKILGILFNKFFFFYFREINPLIQNGIMKIVPKNRYEEKI